MQKMKTKYIIILFLVAILAPATSNAQKKRKTTRKNTNTTASTAQKKDNVNLNLSAEELWIKFGDAVENGNKKNAVEYVKAAAKKGHIDASFIMGLAYCRLNSDSEFTFEIRPMKNDTTKWVSFMFKPIDFGIKQPDYNKAITMLTLCVENGTYLESCYWYLANSYDGIGDMDNFYIWAKKGVEAGDYSCMRLYGYHLLYGHGCTADPQQGIKWLKKADELGDTNASMLLSWYYNEEKECAKAAYWAHQHIKKIKDHAGFFQLGLFYHFGNGVDKDNKKAIDYLRKALELDKEDIATINLLAKCYTEEDGSSYKDEAKRLITKVLESSNATEQQKDNARGLLDILNKK